MDRLGFTALVFCRESGQAATELCLRQAGATADKLNLPSPATCCALTFCTVGLPFIAAERTQVYFEVTIAYIGRCPQIGWATQGFKPDGGYGVGDDSFSWGADGIRGALWHKAKPQAWATRWKDGDVIGCAADLEQGTVWFGCNGTWVVAFEQCAAKWKHGLRPVISGSCMAFALNKTPQFQGPRQGFYNVASAEPLQQLDGDQAGGIFVTL